jgi:hypothetical protein
MRLSLLIVVLTAIPRMALGFDPMAVDILTFRLGMDEEAVLEHLREQGIDGVKIDRWNDVCGGRIISCSTAVTGRTPDGALAFIFTPGPTEQVVGRITYRLPAHRAGEPAAIHRSALDRYGPPNGTQPTSWCWTPDHRRRCSAGQPRLSFEHGPGTMIILTLSDGVTDDPFDPGGEPWRMRGLNGRYDPAAVVPSEAGQTQRITPPEPAGRRKRKRHGST